MNGGIFIAKAQRDAMERDALLAQGRAARTMTERRHAYFIETGRILIDVRTDPDTGLETPVIWATSSIPKVRRA